MWIILCNRQDLNRFHCHTAWRNQWAWLACTSSLAECFSSEIFFHLMYLHIKISKMIKLLKNQASNSMIFKFNYLF